MQLDNLLKISVQDSKHFPTSGTTSNNSQWDHVQIKHEGSTEEDSVVTLSEAVIKRFSSGYSNPPKIRYEMDRESKRIVANIIDPESGKVIREIPNEENRQLSKKIGEFLKEFFSLV
tara:strand:- start:556 stop:906 length:351 start_codon:yes stop_codon:yes gene_type:complete